VIVLSILNRRKTVSSSATPLHFAMSLYYEAGDILTAPNNAGGGLKSRIFSKKDLKSQPAQIYALVIETCKWSSVLKEIIENAEILRLERKVIIFVELALKIL
jgi:putative methyltransferase